MSKKYPRRYSSVEVTFQDGEVRRYRMSATPAIAQWLMREAAQTGTLVLRDDARGSAICIPMANVRHVEIGPCDDEGGEGGEEGASDGEE